MQRPDEAERIAAEVLKANRGNARAAQVLGQVQLMQNRGAEAIAPLEKAARRSEDPLSRPCWGRRSPPPAAATRRSSNCAGPQRGDRHILRRFSSTAFGSQGGTVRGGDRGARKRPCARA